MSRILTVVLLGLGTTAFVFGLPEAPEIDPGAGATALALLGGTILLISNKTRKR